MSRFSMQLPLATFLFLLLFLPAIYPEAVPQLYSSATYTIYDWQTVVIAEGSMSKLNVSHALPIGGEIVSAPKNSIVISDEWGNPRLQILEQNPPDSYVYAINTSVTVKKARVTSLPTSYSTTEDLSQYLEPSNFTPSDSQQMRELAQSIVENASTRFEQVALLALWTHNLIEYDASYVGMLLPAEEILQEKRGVCTEYATLFITLARSIGIPARYVSGYAYSDRFGAWLGHAWAEVYLGKWVGVDPTWLEVGEIDATHIASAKRPSHGFETSKVSALVYPPTASLMFEGGTSQGVIADNVRLVSYVEELPDELQVQISSSKMPKGSKFIAYARIPSDQYRLVEAFLAPCKGQFDLTEIPNSDAVAILSPNRTTNIIWEGKVSTNLPDNYLFTCPLTLNSVFFKTVSTDAKISTSDKVYWPKIKATLANPYPYPGSLQAVNVQVPKGLAGMNLTLISKDIFAQKEITKPGEISFVFEVGGKGRKEIYVFAPAGDPVKLEYDVLPFSGIKFSSLNLSHDAFEGDMNELGFSFDSKNGIKGEIVPELEWTGQKVQGEPFAIKKGTNKHALSFTPSSSGTSLAILRLLSGGTEIASTSFLLDVAPAPSAEVYQIVSQPAGEGKSKVTFKISSDGEVSQIKLEVDGNEVSVINNAATLELEDGNYFGQLQWLDQRGNKHSKEFEFIVSSPPAKNDTSPFKNGIFGKIEENMPFGKNAKPQQSQTGTVQMPISDLIFYPILFIFILFSIAFILHVKHD